MKFLSAVLPKKAPAKPVLAEFAECESSWATGTTRIHLRRTELHDELVKGGGLKLLGIAAACGTEVSWDLQDVSRERIISSLPNQHPSFHYCIQCLKALEILPAG